MPFAFLESFHGVAFFGLDEMHFLGHGVAQQFWRLICGEFQADGDEQHVFALRTLQPETIGQLIEESRGTIPVAFQGTWKNVAKYSRRYRAVDWIDFLMHVAPTVILDNLRHEDTKRAAFSLLRACSIALQWHLTEDDIRQIERYVLASSFLLACIALYIAVTNATLTWILITMARFGSTMLPSYTRRSPKQSPA